MKPYATKLFAGAAIAAFALMAFAPSASADPATASISRTFPTPDVGVRIEWKGDGTGLYSLTDPDNVCVVSILGLQTFSAFYYDQLRKHTNGNRFLLQTNFNLGPVGPIDCPDILEVTPKGADKFANLEDANVYTGSWILQDTILCSKKNSGDTCIPSPPADWDLYSCPAMKPATDFTYVDDGKSFFDPLNDVLNGPAPIPDGVGSRSVNSCDYNEDASYDVSEKMVEYGANFVASGFQGVPASHVCPVGGGPCVVVSCVSVDVSQYDEFFQLVDAGPAVSHDWFLVLDTAPGSAAANAAAISWFEGTGAQNQAEKGLYDLGGQNGCPFDDIDNPQPDKKAKESGTIDLPPKP